MPDATSATWLLAKIAYRAISLRSAPFSLAPRKNSPLGYFFTLGPLTPAAFISLFFPHFLLSLHPEN
jgi:hypothetical protein